MAGKDFEHQVHDRLDGWGMDPSEGVWGKLEAALERRKRRRRGFVVFLLAGLLAAGGTWYMMPATTDAPVAGVLQGAGKQMQGSGRDTQIPGGEVQVPVSDTHAPGLAKQEESTAQQADAPSGITHDAGAVSTDIPVLANARSIEEAFDAKASQVPVAQVNSISVKQRKPRAQRSAIPVPMVSEAEGQKDVVGGNPAAGDAFDNATTPAARSSQASMEQVSAARPSHTGLPVVPVDASAAPVLTGTTQPFVPPPAPAASAKLPETDNRERRMAFGVSVGIGRSGFTDGLLPTPEKAADLPVTGSTGGVSVNPYQYRQDPSLGFSAGAWMRLPVAKRLTANLGLAYAKWSTRTPVGQSLPDTGRVFNNGIADLISAVGYTQGNQHTYRNNYHLLQLPLDLSWQINKGRKLPMLWEIGISPGVLLSSNALVRDSARALFSHPDNQRRFQLGLRTAFLFRLMPSSARPLELGPVFQYQLNQVFTESARDNGHLFYLGVEARMPIFFLARKQRVKQ